MSNESMANYITDIPSGIAELLALNKQLKQQLSLMGCEFAEYEKTKKELREAVKLLEKNKYVLRFEYFKKGYSLSQETIAELESRIEQSVDISVVNELNETIKTKDALIEKLEQRIKDIEWRMV